jgi:hypothetical protein
MYKAYIEPDLLGADVFVNNNFNPFRGESECARVWIQPLERAV